MSTFNIKITPPHGKPSKENREPTNVLMAPFSEKSIVTFENVPLMKTAIRILRIINPSDDTIQVQVTKNLRPEHNVTLEWTENSVASNNTITMEIKWTPTMNIACKESLQLLDNRNFRKDVTIILKSKSNDHNKHIRKFPTLSSCRSSSILHSKNTQIKNPPNSPNEKGLKLPLQQNRKSITNKRMEMPNRRSQQKFQDLSTKVPKGFNKNDNTDMPSVKITYIGDECKNNMNASGGSFTNLLDMIDNLQFTPIATKPIEKIGEYPENVSYVLTPNNKMYNNNHEEDEVVKLKPKCLGDNLLDSGNKKDVTYNVDILKDDSKHITNGMINNTFDVKHSAESLSVSPTEFNNKTTIIDGEKLGSFLDIIPEDDQEIYCASYAVKNRGTRFNEKVNVTKISNGMDLLRDVKLVGNPLRKHSHSLKDLHHSSLNANSIAKGSLPNLNEMETIGVFEENRYFNQDSTYCKSINVNVNDQMNQKPQVLKNVKTNVKNDNDKSLLRCPEVTFDQCEILAQSSRFNLNEINCEYKYGSNQVNKTPHLNSRHRTPVASSTNQKVEHNRNYLQQINTPYKRRANEISYIDSCNMNSTNKMLQPPSINHNDNMLISPPKRQRLDEDITQAKFNPVTPRNASYIKGSRQKTWSNMKTNNIKLSRNLSLMKRSTTPRKTVDNIKQDFVSPRIQLYNSELYLQTCINPDPFAATTTCDPFLTSTMYLDEASVERHQNDLKKWLNALVMIPAELKTDDVNTKIDVGKLFNEVRNKELIVAPTKEKQSLKYLNNFRLETLRRAAVDLYLSEEIRSVCSKVTVYVKKNSIRIRQDRNLHLDVVTQRDILELLLCFNPLWLRLGLEVVYGEKIHLQSNCDIVGISAFILNRLFRDKYLEQKFSKAYTLGDEYADHIKKFTLQKFLLLLLFLDKAKGKRIIAHDPCLFVKKSSYKETREVLLRFSAELLANVGDITRELKRLGYVLVHKQSYLDEYDYAFNNLAIDLRDGVRLTRIMEIILLRDDLTKQLRVPAISRLQRIFNINLALKALSDADFQLTGDITANDIVIGHREKTLSLLWQIIYKFRSPKFHAAARVIQKWWRKSWLKIVIHRRIRDKLERKRQQAAIIIQSRFRGYSDRKYVNRLRLQYTKAAIVLQKYARRFVAQKRLVTIIQSILIIQRWFRACKKARICREEFMKLRNSAICLQQCWRLRKTALEIRAQALLSKIQWNEFKQKAVIRMQACWRRYTLRKKYLRIISAIVMIQRHFRMHKLMKKERMDYENLKRNAIVIQRRIRANQAMKQQCMLYNNIKNATISIQRWYRSIIAMRTQRIAYLHIMSCIVCIQRKWRAILLMRTARLEYVTLQKHVIVIQKMYRGKKQMQIDYNYFQQYKSKVLWVQRYFRGKLQMRYDRKLFKNKIQACSIIQKHYRTYREMCKERSKYHKLKTATIYLQRQIRNYLIMKRQRQEFLALKRATQIIQQRYKDYRITKRLRLDFLQLRKTVIRIQQHIRGKRLMLRNSSEYQSIRRLIIVIQRRYRAKLLGRQVRQQYLLQRQSVIYIQRKYRALQMMKKEKANYHHTRRCIIVLQRTFRAYLFMKTEREHFLQMREAAVRIQIWYRSILSMRRQQEIYLHKMKLIILIQNKWRAILQGQKQRVQYLNIRSKVIILQRKLRARREMRLQHEIFKRQKDAAIMLQRHFRRYREMLKIQEKYHLERSIIIWVQRKFRAKLCMLRERKNFLRMRQVVIMLQRKFRDRKRMYTERLRFLKLKSALINFQAFVRGYLARQRFQMLITPEAIEFYRKNKAAKKIQRIWRGYRIRKRIRNTVLLQIRHNIILFRKTSRAADAVGVKIQDAIRFLSGRFCAADALEILKRLDSISRTVPHLMIESSDYIPTFCYGIMAQSIRSETDKYLVMYCSRIILNLARYNSTTANTFQENGLVTIAQMLLRWCDKECEIFNILCTLIWVFAHCPIKRKIIHDFMTTTEAVYMVRETKKLVARKEKMKQNVRKSVSQQLRQQNHRLQKVSKRFS